MLNKLPKLLNSKLLGRYMEFTNPSNKELIKFQMENDGKVWKNTSHFF